VLGKIEDRTRMIRMPLAQQRGLSRIFLSVFIRVAKHQFTLWNILLIKYFKKY